MALKRIIFVVAINLTVLIYCGILYYRGQPVVQTLLIFVVAAVIVNLVAELPRRRAAKKRRAVGRPTS
jgi:hypothetical protein